MNHLNNPIQFDMSHHINDNYINNDNILDNILDNNINNILQQDIIGLPIDQDPVELLDLLRTLSENYIQTKTEMTKIKNSRDHMIDVKRLLELELSKIRIENNNILQSVDEVANKLQQQSITIEEQLHNIKKQGDMLLEKDVEIARLNAIILNMKNECNNDKDDDDNNKLYESEILKDISNKDEAAIEIHTLDCGSKLIRISDDHNSNEDLTSLSSNSNDSIPLKCNSNDSESKRLNPAIEFFLKL